MQRTVTTCDVKTCKKELVDVHRAIILGRSYDLCNSCFASINAFTERMLEPASTMPVLPPSPVYPNPYTITSPIIPWQTIGGQTSLQPYTVQSATWTNAPPVIHTAATSTQPTLDSIQATIDKIITDSINSFN